MPVAAHFDLHHTVTDDEIDSQQHVHNLRYLHWSLGAASAHVAALGWDAAGALKQGLGWVVRDHQITYRAAALAGDDLIIRTWVADVRRYAIIRHYWICRKADQRVLAKVQTRWVFVDLNEHRALAIPDRALDAIVVSDQPPPLPWQA